jgi:DNA-binding response OmpR family regulator
MLTLLLEGMNYCVLPAASGQEALTAAANNDIDLVLTDFNLPDMTGPTVARNVRKLDRLAYIPVVMLTAIDAYEYRSLAAQAGCDAFFVKPPNFEMLKATIDQLLKLKKEMVGVTATFN